MQNFFKIFQKKSSRHGKYNIPDLAYGLKEVTLFLKPIYILREAAVAGAPQIKKIGRKLKRSSIRVISSNKLTSVSYW